MYSLAATTVRVLGYGNSSEEHYIRDASRFGVDHKRGVMPKLATMEFHARQEVVHQLATCLAEAYQSVANSDSGHGTPSHVRLRLALVLLECLQLDRKARPCIGVLQDTLEYCLANVARW